MPWIFLGCGFQTFELIHSKCTSHIFTFGHIVKTRPKKEGSLNKMCCKLSKRIINPIIFQGPHNPFIVCQPPECDCNEWTTIPTLWPSKDWKYLLVCIDAPIFCLIMGCKARSYDFECCLEMGHNKQLLGVARWAITRIWLGMWVLCYEVHNQLLRMEVYKSVS
jgi:hypothetical protein